MGPIGPVVSSFLRRNPTSDEIREVIKIIEHFNPKASPESNSSSSSSSNNNVIYFSPSTDQEHSEPDTHEDVRVNPRGDSNQKEQEKISVTASQELVQKGDKDEDNNKQEYSDLNYSKSPSVTTASSVPPTKSNREGDKVVPPQSDQDEIQADTPLENLEDLFKKYGLSLIPRPVSENDPAVITPDSYTSLPHYANHISRKARKKPSYPTPLPNRISLRSISLQKEKMSLDSLDPGSTAFERYTTFNVANNNAGDNNAVNAVVNKEEPILEATDHSRLDSGGGAGPPAAQGTLRSMEKICRQKQLVNNWLSGDAEMNYGDFNLGSLVDESITKPIMRQIIKGESHFLENHKVRFGNDY